ncbi:MAG: ABC transporter ATP-binding protein [Anaerolineae bacterium]
MDTIIETQSLGRQFGSHWAVRDLTLSVGRGQVFGFLGPNGAGKTTTVRLLNGILQPSAGSAQVLSLDPIEKGTQIRRRTGVLTENPSLYESLTARQNLRFFGTVYGVEPEILSQRIEALLTRFGLLQRGDDKTGTYSRGMKQRLAIARALIHEPEILFLDEPTSGLDPAASRDVLDLVQELAQRLGHTIFICTHNLVEAEKLCDVVGVIHQGSLRAVGSPEQLARQLWQRNVLELDLRGSPEGLRSTLLAVPGVTGVAYEGELTLVDIADEEVTPAVTQAAVSAGARVYGVHLRRHGLEDVYFALEQEQADTSDKEGASHA